MLISLDLKISKIKAYKTSFNSSKIINFAVLQVGQ